MAYPGVDWQDKPSTASPINRTNLEIMDNGIIDAHEKIETLSDNLDVQSSVVEGYLYNKAVDETYSISSAAQYNNLNYRMDVGKTYVIEVEFTEISSTNLSKLSALRTTRGTGSSSMWVDVLTFDVPLSQMQANTVYKTYYSPTQNVRYIYSAFASGASFSTDKLNVKILETDVRFADKTTEIVANLTYKALKKTAGLTDITFTNGLYLKRDGTTDANNNFMVSDYIDVIPGTDITYYIHSYNQVAMINLYDENKQVKRYVSSANETNLEGTLTVNSNEVYMRVCRWSTSKNANDSLSFIMIIDAVGDIEELQSQITPGKQWDGKVWHCFGTSLSNVGQEGKYPTYLAEMSGLQYVNFAYSGGKLTNHILQRIKSDSSIASADLITVEGFVNDWSQQSPMGEITDTTADTFYGAMYEAITYILTNSNATLVFITDNTGRNYNSIDIRRQAVRNGKTQNDFIEATIKMCNYMGIPVIDAGRKSCISQDTASLYLADQIHHTEKGGEQFAQTIWSELKNIPCRIK